MSPSIITKSGLMLGLGEAREEVKGVIYDLCEIDCDILTIGQYLRPSNSHFPVADFVKPEVFDEFEAVALRTGIKAVSSSPFVRSSYLAETHYRRVLKMKDSFLS